MSEVVFSRNCLPGPAQRRKGPRYTKLAAFNTCTFIVLCCLNTIRFSINQLPISPSLQRFGLWIDVAWFPPSAIMFLVNFLHRGRSRYTSYFVVIALVGLFDFLQNNGSVPLQDIPFVVDIGLALGWSISHQPALGRQLARHVTHEVAELPSDVEQGATAVAQGHSEGFDREFPQQSYQASSHQTNQQQFMPR